MGEEMSDGNEPAGGDGFALARERYEAGRDAVAAIAADLGIGAQALIVRARREGWRLRGKPSKKAIGTRETIARLKGLLQRRLAEFETQINVLGAEANAASSEREIRSMNTLVRTLEKVLELERKDRAHRHKRRKDHKQFDDAERDQLADKLAALGREWAGKQAEPASDPGGDAGAEPRFSLLGPRAPATAA